MKSDILCSAAAVYEHAQLLAAAATAAAWHAQPSR